MADLGGLPVGTILNNQYRIVRRLGDGGFGITYQCEDRDGRPVYAVKEYYPRNLGNRRSDGDVVPQRGQSTMFEKFSDRFWDEAHHLSNFDHPNIVHVVQRFRQFGTRYLVMEFIDGPRLSDEIKRNGPIDPLAVMLIAEKLVDALKTIHALNLVHRDIKPGNIMLRAMAYAVPTRVTGLSDSYRKYFGRPVLLDFGSTREIDRSGNPVTVIYTPDFAAPEQFEANEPLDKGTDIFGLGATLYACLMGEGPASVARRRDGVPISILSNTLSGKAPAGFLKAVDKALNLKRSDRQDTIEQFEAEMFS